MASSIPVLFGLAITYPVLRFLLLPLWPGLGPEIVAPAGDGPGLAAAITGTLRLATLSAVCALPPAIWFGTMLERRTWWGRWTLGGTLLLLFLLPGYLVAAGWQIVLGAGVFPVVPWLGDALLGWPGLVGLTTLKGLPVATLAVRAGWIAHQPRLDEATRLHVRERWRRAMLTARPVLPACAAAFLIVFVEATQEYGLAATIGARLHVPLLVTDVYASLANWPISWVRAAQAGDLLVLIGLTPVAIRLVFGWRTVPRLDRGFAVLPPRASVFEQSATVALLSLVFTAGCLVPLAALVADALEPNAGVGLGGAWPAIRSSLLYSFVASLAALGLACGIVAPRAGSWLQMAAGWLPLVNIGVPGIVLGAAGVIAFNGPPLPLIGTPLALLVAQTASQLPILALFLHAPLRACGGTPGDAARVHGVGVLDRIERIHLPPLVRPLVWAWALAFCRLFFELPLAQMLAPAGGEPVGVALVQLQQSLRFAAEARLAMVAVLVCLGITGTVLLLAERTR